MSLLASIMAQIFRAIAPPAGGDPDFASVISLLHFDGTNASTTITDQISGKTWTASGSTALSTTDPKFGTACLLVPDSGRVISNTDAGDAFGTGDFTVEFWINPISWATDIIYDTRTAATQVRPALYYTGGTLRYYANGADRITGGAISTGVYSHIALCRSGTDTRLFINGTQSGSTYTDSNNYVNDRTAWGDASYTTGNNVNGRIDDARITKGVARYTAAFTPPTEAFPDSAPPGGTPSYHQLVLDANPLQYWRLDETSGTTLEDAVGTNDLTIAGTYTLDIAPTTEVEGRAIKFTSAGATPVTQTVPANGTNGYTVEFLVKLFTVDSAANAYIYSRANSGDVVFNYGGANRIGIFKNSGAGTAVATSALGPTIPRDDQWHHVVIGYNDVAGRWEAWLDGQFNSTFTATAPTFNTTQRLGRVTSDVAPFVGGLDEFAVYDRWLTAEEIQSHAFRALYGIVWTPAEIATALWLDAADETTITESAGRAPAWADKSGNAVNASAPTGPTIVAGDLNGLDTLRWQAAANEPFALASTVDIYQHTAVMVVRHDVAALGQLFSHSSLNRQLRFQDTGGEVIIAGVTPIPFNNTLITTGQNTGQYYIVALEGDPAEGRFFVNGAANSAGGTLASAFVFDQIGVRSTSSERLNGRIAEVVWVPVFNDAPTRQRIEGYLAHKWGMAGDLPGGHPYKNAAPTTAWIPADITTSLWLDAADDTVFTLTGSDIDQLADKSGNARHATPATATKPTRTATGINSMGSIVFGSGTDPLITPSFEPPAATDGLLAFAVLVRTGTPVNYSNPFTFGAVNAQFSLIIGSSALSIANGRSKYFWRNGTGGTTTATSPEDVVVTDTPALWSGVMANAGISQLLNGVLLTGTTEAAARNLGASAAMTIGSSPDGSYATNQLQGQLAEYILVPADITAATRHLIEGYLAHKWGLAGDLPVGHPYKSATPTLDGPLPATTWDSTPVLKNISVTLSNGDADMTKAAGGYRSVYATRGRSSGIYAFECEVISRVSISSILVGFADTNNAGTVLGTFVGTGVVNTIGWNDNNGSGSGRVYRNMTAGSDTGATTAAYAPGDVLTISLDFDTNTASFYKNGVLAFTRAFTAGREYVPVASVQSGPVIRIRGSGLTHLPAGATEWDA